MSISLFDLCPKRVVSSASQSDRERADRPLHCSWSHTCWNDESVSQAWSKFPYKAISIVSVCALIKAKHVDLNSWPERGFYSWPKSMVKTVSAIIILSSLLWAEKKMPWLCCLIYTRTKTVLYKCLLDNDPCRHPMLKCVRACRILSPGQLQ